MSPSQLLKELGVSAVLGSDRAGADCQGPASLLHRAAIAAVKARAGRRCRLVPEAIAPCPSEPFPIATPLQAALLDRLLAAPDAALIQEWCARAVARGVRVPAVTVPMLLDWWSKQPRRSPEIFEATGACGAWIVNLHAEWRKPVAVSEIPENADECWQTGSSAERVATLLTVRQKDPTRALEMVRSTWSADGAVDRRKFVQTLVHGISSADEAFLEAALDDRSKVVRREAAQALTRLAHSALRTRMNERAARMIAVEKTKVGLLRRTRINVTIEPPKEFNASWERDGIDQQPAVGKGTRAF